MLYPPLIPSCVYADFSSNGRKPAKRSPHQSRAGTTPACRCCGQPSMFCTVPPTATAAVGSLNVLYSAACHHRCCGQLQCCVQYYVQPQCCVCPNAKCQLSVVWCSGEPGQLSWNVPCCAGCSDLILEDDTVRVLRGRCAGHCHCMPLHSYHVAATAQLHC